MQMIFYYAIATIENVCPMKNRSPVDTGRKLNVISTFNLRPVSTGRWQIILGYLLIILIACVIQ